MYHQNCEKLYHLDSEGNKEHIGYKNTFQVLRPTDGFSIKRKGKNVDDIVQYHYTKWPDHGVPEAEVPKNTDPKEVKSTLITFIEQFKEKNTFIHCSAGVGRTGVTIALMHYMNGGTDSIDELVSSMRNLRSNMVQEPDQFIFLYNEVMKILSTRTESRTDAVDYSANVVNASHNYENVPLKQSVVQGNLESIYGNQKIIEISQQKEEINSIRQQYGLVTGQDSETRRVKYKAFFNQNGYPFVSFSQDPNGSLNITRYQPEGEKVIRFSYNFSLEGIITDQFQNNIPYTEFIELIKPKPNNNKG